MNRLKSVMEKHPLVKGMVAYSIIWPTGCTIQQYIMNEPTGICSIVLSEL